MGLSAAAVLALAASLVLGAVVQGTVGLGLGLVAAPVAALVAPGLVPELLLWLALAMAATTLVPEHREIHWWGLWWALPARALGTVVGVAVVAALPVRGIGIAVDVIVLTSVILTVRTVDLPINRVTLPTAGFVSGVAGTATSIGGPPLAVLYQHRPPGMVRSTLAAYFIVGAAMSLVGLGVTGQTDAQTLRLALVLSPCLLLGWAIALPLRRRLPAARVRAGILAVCAASSVALLLRSLLG